VSLKAIVLLSKDMLLIKKMSGNKFEIPKVLDVTALGLGLTSLVLHVLGTVFPYWWTVHERDERNLDWTFYYGIWEIVNCRNGDCVNTSSRMEGDRGKYSCNFINVEMARKDIFVRLPNAGI